MLSPSPSVFRSRTLRRSRVPLPACPAVQNQLECSTAGQASSATRRLVVARSPLVVTRSPDRVTVCAGSGDPRTTTAGQASSATQIANRRGLTLVEMLVSLVCVLLLMMAYTQLFSDVGSKVGESRSMIELTSRMRSAAQRLHADLEAHTCDMKPWQRPKPAQAISNTSKGR